LAAIAQISSEFVTVTRKLRRCIKTVQSAPKEVKHFLNETSIFSSLLTSFYSVAEEATKHLGAIQQSKRAELIDRIAYQCDSAHWGIELFARKVKEIHGGRSSKLSLLCARVLWVLRKPDTEEVQLFMNNAKQTVTLLLSLMVLEQALRGNANEETM
jgi:preprotein translocase subunit Sss1